MRARFTRTVPIQNAKARSMAPPVERVAIVFRAAVVGRKSDSVKDVLLAGDEIERAHRFAVFDGQRNSRGAFGRGVYVRVGCDVQSGCRAEK